MIKTAKSLMDKSKNIATKNNITTNEVLQNYMFERVLERLAISKYKNNFILKGGLLLSSIMGIDTRTTMDMDTCIKGLEVTEEQIYKILQEILNIDIGDNIKFQIRNLEPIKEEDDYAGIKYNILAIFENIRVNLSIDIATGDIITPREIEYEYKMMFEDRSLKIMTYNIETIIAEKFQTVISRNVLNSRMKDYYDIYYLLAYKEFSEENLKIAIVKTFEKRQTDINTVEEVIHKISKSNFVNDLWKNYSKKHYYSSKIRFEEVMKTMCKICTIISEKK